MKDFGEWVETEGWVDEFLVTLTQAKDMIATPANIRFVASNWEALAAGLRKRANEIEQGGKQ